MIAEVDEDFASIKKQTVTVIDDRDPQKHSFHYQLSNFSLLENRETHELELFLTTYGQVPNQDDWSAVDSYHSACEARVICGKMMREIRGGLVGEGARP